MINIPKHICDVLLVLHEIMPGDIVLNVVFLKRDKAFLKSHV